MTIQNIEDVMDRILTLNRNLTEDSLRTLLSASGWDKEDIMEGIHIFKSKSAKDFSYSASPPLSSREPAPEKKEEKTEETLQEPQSPVHNTYTFNISKKDDDASVSALDPSQAPAVAVTPGVINNTVLKTDPSQAEAKKETSDTPSLNTSQSASSSEEPKKHSSIGRIIFVILLILILGLAAFYIYSYYPKKNIRTGVLPPTPAPVMNLQDPTAYTPSNTNLVGSNTLATTSGTTTAVNSMTNVGAKGEYQLLLEEINKLKSDLASYKNSAQSPKTIVKYISQKGPAGSTGRGITYVEATTTGFILNFTDNTQMIVPYSTTTIFNILNSNSVCFQDSNTPASSTNICLDRNTVINLLNR